MSPYKTVCFYNNKGGVGKTTLAFNYAVEMAMRLPDKKILVVDVDCQINSTCLCLGGGTRGNNCVTNIFHTPVNESQSLTYRERDGKCVERQQRDHQESLGECI